MSPRCMKCVGFIYVQLLCASDLRNERQKVALQRAVCGTRREPAGADCRVKAAHLHVFDHFY